MVYLKFKLLILGDSGVGKTSLMNNYLKKPFYVFEASTIGIEYESKELEMIEILPSELYQQVMAREGKSRLTLNQEESIAKLEIWNSSGQDRFRSIVSSYFRGAQGVLIVVDLTRPQTLRSVETWIRDFNRYSKLGIPKIPAIMVANKADLNLERKITNEEIQTFAQKYHIPYYVVSSKMDQDRVQSLFTQITQHMIEAYVAQPIPETQIPVHKTIQLGTGTAKKRRCCS